MILLHFLFLADNKASNGMLPIKIVAPASSRKFFEISLRFSVRFIGLSDLIRRQRIPLPPLLLQPPRKTELISMATLKNRLTEQKHISSSNRERGHWMFWNVTFPIKAITVRAWNQPLFIESSERRRTTRLSTNKNSVVIRDRGWKGLHDRCVVSRKKSQMVLERHRQTSDLGLESNTIRRIVLGVD